MTLQNESVMLERLCAEAESFYADPKNMAAFMAWKEKRYGKDHDHNEPGADAQ
jgi:hypothetical protein